VSTYETPDECANFNEQRELVIRGFVHLNRSIVERSGQPSLEKDVVVPYLQQNLNWGLQKADGEVVKIISGPTSVNGSGLVLRAVDVKHWANIAATN